MMAIEMAMIVAGASHGDILVGGFSSQQIDLSFLKMAMITATGAMTIMTKTKTIFFVQFYF